MHLEGYLDTLKLCHGAKLFRSIQSLPANKILRTRLDGLVIGGFEKEFLDDIDKYGLGDNWENSDWADSIKWKSNVYAATHHFFLDNSYI